MKTKLILVILLFRSFHCFSSDFYKGYIIKQNGEKINGLIKKGTDIEYKTVVVFDDLKNAIEAFPPSAISSFYIEDLNVLYESKTIQTELGNSQVFLKCLVKGKVSLYQLPDIELTIFFLQKDGKLIELTNTPVEKIKDGVRYKSYRYEYISPLKNEVLSDCKELFFSIDKLKFQVDNMIAFTNDYNECIDPAGINENYSGKARTIKLETAVILQGGLNYPRQGGGNIIGAGLAEGFRLPSTNERFNLNIAVIVEYGTFQEDKFSYKSHFINIRLPIVINYEFGKHKLRPFLCGGFSPWLIKEGKVVYKNGYVSPADTRFYPTIDIIAGAGLRIDRYKILAEVNRYMCRLQLAYFFI